MRKTKRIALDEAARLHPNDWSSLEVRVLDMSEAGFRAACDARILCGSPVSIEVPGIGQIEAQVSWRRGGEIGAKFVRPIDLARCGWKPAGEAQILARLLVQRAAARRSGRFEDEQSLRRRILKSLPLAKA